MARLDVDEFVSDAFRTENGITYVGNADFNYSDGDASEEYLAEVISAADNLASTSAELESKMVDWASRYHLSSGRANAFRALDVISDRSSVLEIGSGCGAITRYLGECGATVIGVEGSPRRAKIARSRTADLPNVQIVCGSFHEICFKRQFDFVVCNGVLEYAPMFFAAEAPFEALMETMARLTTDDGALLLAIENKLGLRYWCSGKEDHTGIMFDGIEGYCHSSTGPQTFSRKELINLASRHYSSVELLLPLPDYKFPRAIVREDFAHLVDLSELFAATEDYAYPTRVAPLFHQRLAWQSAARAGLLGELSNSHFIVARHSKTCFLPPAWQGSIMKRTKSKDAFEPLDIFAGISTEGKSNIYVQRRALGSEPSPWMNGPSLHSIVAKALLHYGRSREWLHAASSDLRSWWETIFPTGARSASGAHVDAIWRNAIKTEHGVKLIDQELSVPGSISPEFVLYRTVLNFVSDEALFIDRWQRRNQFMSEYSICRSVAAAVGVTVTFRAFRKAIWRELSFQCSMGNSMTGAGKRLTRFLLPIVLIRWATNAKHRLSFVVARIRNRL